MLMPLPKTTPWKQHIEKRVVDAKALGLLSGNHHLIFEQSVCFIPDVLSENSLGEITPATSIRNLKKNTHPSNDWIEREDMFDEAAEWLRTTYVQPLNTLICEAGFSKQGDKVLNQRQHFILGDTPILWVRLNTSGSPDIARMLRWARSLRLIGIIANLTTKGSMNINDPQLFICDVFDGDSLACCVIESV
jgi:hypothetical protein